LEDNNALLVHGKGIIPTITTTLTPTGAKKMVAQICKEQDVSYKLVSSLIQQESEWNPNNINHNKNGTTDYGLMQLNSSNKEFFEKKFWDRPEKFDMKNPEHNVYVGVRFFKALLGQYKNDVKKALTAYNAGSGALARGTVPDSTIHYRNDIFKNFKS
jgi:soluble lytic murein transglycosylase-like protein